MTLFVFKDDIVDAGVEPEALMGVPVVFLGTHKNALLILPLKFLLPVLLILKRKGHLLIVPSSHKLSISLFPVLQAYCQN